MSVITVCKIENDFLDLENKIRKLKVLCDSLTFRMTIKESIKLLLSIFKLTENKKNLFGKKIASELLINITSFLSYDCRLSCQYICKSWNEILQGNLAKKILLPIPKGFFHHSILHLNFSPKRIVKVKNNIYTSGSDAACKIDIERFEQIIDKDTIFYDYISSSNDNYICVGYLDKLVIYSLDSKLTNEILVKESQGSAICNDKIYIATNNKFYIYNFGGKLINLWDLVDNSNRRQQSRQIALSNNRIYMVDTSFNCIKKFSPEGKLIKSWGSFGDQHGEFKNPWGITIYRDIIFVVDTGNKRIQAFNCHGDFVFQYKCVDVTDMADIIIKDDYIYVNDWKTTCITKLKLIYY
jgi:hypothetical protein